MYLNRLQLGRSASRLALCALLGLLCASCSRPFEQRDISVFHGSTPLLPDKMDQGFEYHIGRLLMEQNFKELEVIAKQLRRKKEKLPSGRWKLDTYYNAIREDSLGSKRLKESGQRVAFLEYWIRLFPKSATPRIALADVYIEKAWEARGGRFAGHVKDGAWTSFEEYLQKAWDELVLAEELSRSDPCLYERWLTAGVGLGIDREQQTVILEQGLKIDPLYRPILRAMVMYLLPRWHGEAGEIKRLAEQLAESQKERSGDAIYALMASQTQVFAGSDFFKHYDFSWDRIKQGFIDLESVYPGSLKHTCVFGRFACIGQDPETARIVFRRIGEQWNEDIETIFRNRNNFLRWKRWAKGEISFPGIQEIHIAARDGDLTALQQLIDSGAELDAIDNGEKTPLMWAIAKYNTDVALYLIEKGADVNIVAAEIKMQ